MAQKRDLLEEIAKKIENIREMRNLSKEIENIREMRNLSKEIEGIREMAERIAKEREKMILALGVDSFIEGRVGIIRSFSVNRLAQILYECVECQDKPRALTDWLTAEKFFDNNFSPGMKKELARRDLILRAYDCLRREQSGLSPISGNVIHYFDEGIGEYYGIMKRLLELSREKRKELFAKAADSDEKRYEYIGRLIWEWGYQKIQGQLPCPPYGQILFY